MVFWRKDKGGSDKSSQDTNDDLNYIDFQSISSSSSENLNEMARSLNQQSAVSGSLGMLMMEENPSPEDVINYLRIKSQPSSNFLYEEGNQVTFEMAQNNFLEYLRKRMGKQNC
jgi:hypothetical protein